MVFTAVGGLAGCICLLLEDILAAGIVIILPTPAVDKAERLIGWLNEWKHFLNSERNGVSNNPPRSVFLVFYSVIKYGKQTNDCLVKEGSMALSGVNRLCKGCDKCCKQWKQITIVKCPAYERKQDARFRDMQVLSTAE